MVTSDKIINRLITKNEELHDRIDGLVHDVAVSTLEAVKMARTVREMGEFIHVMMKEEGNFLNTIFEIDFENGKVGKPGDYYMDNKYAHCMPSEVWAAVAATIAMNAGLERKPNIRALVEALREAEESEAEESEENGNE